MAPHNWHYDLSPIRIIPILYFHIQTTFLSNRNRNDMSLLLVLDTLRLIKNVQAQR